MVLFKYLINIFFTILFFLTIEMLLYIKDYNEVTILSEYISYDIKNKGISSFNGGIYTVEIIEGDNVSYIITYNRNTIIAFESFKSIKYDGIVY